MRLKQFLPLLLFSISCAVMADADGEREALAQIIHELDTLKPLIQEARSQSNPDARIEFEYNWLASDIHLIRTGIEEQLIAPRTQPRSFPPLKGDYRH